MRYTKEDPINDNFNTISHNITNTTYNRFYGGVLAPNGKIIFVRELLESIGESYD